MLTYWRDYVKGFAIGAAISVVPLYGLDSDVAPSNTYDVYLDPSLGDRVVEERKALSEWEKAEHLQFNEVSYQPLWHGITISLAEPNFVVENNSKPLGYTSRYSGLDSANITLNKDMVDRTAILIVSMHEIGHSLGVPHDEKGTLMYPIFSADMAREITCRDRARFSEARQRFVPKCWK